MILALIYHFGQKPQLRGKSALAPVSDDCNVWIFNFHQQIKLKSESPNSDVRTLFWPAMKPFVFSCPTSRMCWLNTWSDTKHIKNTTDIEAENTGFYQASSGISILKAYR